MMATPSNSNRREGTVEVATRHEVQYLDDLEQKEGRVVEADHPDTAFELDGRSYVVDLCGANKEKLLGVLAPFIAAARRAGISKRRIPPSGPSLNGRIRPARPAAAGTVRSTTHVERRNIFCVDPCYAVVEK